MNELLHNNQLFTGLVGAMLAGSVLFLLKAVPIKLLQAIIDSVMVEVTVLSRDQIFGWTIEWMARHKYTRTARRLRLDEGIGEGSGWRLAPGMGLHIIWDGWNPIFVKRGEKDSKDDGQAQFASSSRESITIKTFGRSQEHVRGVIKQIIDIRNRRDAVEIRVWQGWWTPLTSKTKRDLSTVFLPVEMKTRLINDLGWFFQNSDWYAARGIPWRLGWLFRGLPGSGKTSIVRALAGHFDHPIYYLNLSTVSDDNALLAAFTQAPARCIMLIEDVDTASAASSRTEPVVLTKSPSPPGAVPATERKGVTLSGLLNAIDGVASADGRLLVMTTNHPEKLDPALLRPGRIDAAWDFGTLATIEVAAMVRNFHPGSNGLADEVAALADAPRTAAEWQQLLMANKDSKSALLDKLRGGNCG